MNALYAAALSAILVGMMDQYRLLASDSPGMLKLSTEQKSFVNAKEQQARDISKVLNEKISPDIWRFFGAADEGDFSTANDIYKQMVKRHSSYNAGIEDNGLAVASFQTVIEVHDFLSFKVNSGPKYTELFGREIIGAMPRGSVYFGGTGPGRSVVTGMSKSHQSGDPIYVISQNMLADSLYLKYLRSMYAKRIHIPSDVDIQRCFSEYMADVQQRAKNNQLKPGEDFREIGGRMQVSGQVAVMNINALIAKDIFDENPELEFFIEESFPLEWMYPHLSPAGPILKINRQPLTDLTVEMVRKDHDYWDRLIQPMIGKWLKEDTTIAAVCHYCQRIYGEKNFDDFQGDPDFAASPETQMAFAKLRSAIANVYAWRAKNSNDPKVKKRMTDAADYAFRQALALRPHAAELIFRYANLCLEQKPARTEDALAVARVCQKLDPRNKQVKDLINRLERMGENDNR